MNENESHFHNGTFSIKKFIKGVLLLQIILFLQRIFRWILAGLYFKTTLSHSIRQHKLSNYYYSIIFNWTRWLLNERNENFSNDVSVLGSFGDVSVKFLDEITVGLVRLKKLSRETFCKLWQIYRSPWKW